MKLKNSNSVIFSENENFSKKKFGLSEIAKKKIFHF